MTYFSSKKLAPSRAVVNIDGTDYPLKDPHATIDDPSYAGLSIGTASKGLYIYIEDVEMKLFPDRCRSYYFQVDTADGSFRLPETGYYGTCDYMLRDLKTAEPHICMAKQPLSCADNWVDTQTPSSKQIPISPALPNMRDGELYWMKLVSSASWGAIAINTDGDSALAAQASPSTPGNGGLYRIESLSSQVLDLYNFDHGGQVISDLRGDRPYGLYAKWAGVASSSDGSKLVAIQSAVYSLPGEIPRMLSGSFVYTSQDYGETWIRRERAGSGDWTSVASSGDGSLLVAVQQGDITTPNPAGGIYRSNDSGVSFRSIEPGAGEGHWSSVASSEDGLLLVAVRYGGSIYTGDGSGNWTEQSGAGQGLWTAVASSGDGAHLVAVMSGGYIHTSNDFGFEWTMQQNSSQGLWTAVATSSDGSLVVAAMSNDYLYLSEDFGVHWKQLTHAGKSDWTGVACSSTGSSLVAIDSSGRALISRNAGTTWQRSLQGRDPPGGGSGEAVIQGKLSVGIALSSDGNHLALAESKGYLYTSSDTGTGTSWQRQSESMMGEWVSVASAANGQYLLAAQHVNTTGQPGYVYASHDAGQNWDRFEGLGAGFWSGVAVHEAYMMAVQERDSLGGPGSVYLAGTYGGWSQREDVPGKGFWSGVDYCLSALNPRFLLAQNKTDSGTEGKLFSWDANDGWVELSGAGSAHWAGIAASGDCTRIVAVQYMNQSGGPGRIVWSEDSGTSWNYANGTGEGFWTGVAASKGFFTRPPGPWSRARRQRSNPVLAAVQQTNTSGLPGSVFVSFDYGMNWRMVTELQPAYWKGVALTGDGSLLVLTASNSSSIYVAGNNPFPPIGVVVAVAAAVGNGVGLGKSSRSAARHWEVHNPQDVTWYFQA